MKSFPKEASPLASGNLCPIMLGVCRVLGLSHAWLLSLLSHQWSGHYACSPPSGMVTLLTLPQIV